MKGTVTLLGLGFLLIGCVTQQQPNFGSEGGGEKVCLSANLPPNKWTLVSFDNAGAPCWTKPNADKTICNKDTWDWQLHGTLVVANNPNIRYKTGHIETQLWIGFNDGECLARSYNGTIADFRSCTQEGICSGDIIQCSNAGHKYLVEDQDHLMPDLDTSIPFEFLIYHQSPFAHKLGDENYGGFWLFARPSIPAICKSTNYSDLVYRDLVK